MPRTPFPGMDPYLEHPVLWPGVHQRLLIEISKQLAPKLRPRYAISVEERVYFEMPGEQRMPDVWVQEVPPAWAGRHSAGGVAVAPETEIAVPVHIATEPIEVRENYLEILDLYQDQRVVTLIELLSPSNKYSGPGRDLYVQKQQATLKSQTHLVEIDLLRAAPRVLSVPDYAIRRSAPPGEYVICVSRANRRFDAEVYTFALRQRLPKFQVPLAEPDPDVVLDLQAAFEQIYEDGSYMLRVKYGEPCEPTLPPADQVWATERWKEYRAAHPEWFPPRESTA